MSFGRINLFRLKLRSSCKPYYLKAKGIKPSGVYVRKGASCAQSCLRIRFVRMIGDSDGDVFEEMRTVEQGLTFQEAEEAFARYHVNFTEDKYIALGPAKYP